MAEEDVWRRRFFWFMVVRIFGALMFLAGAAIALTDLLGEGWRWLGAILMIFGIADALFAPKLLRKQWEMEDQASNEP